MTKVMLKSKNTNLIDTKNTVIKIFYNNKGGRIDEIFFFVIYFPCLNVHIL